jgi:hypothetical protein
MFSWVGDQLTALLGTYVLGVVSDLVAALIARWRWPA